MTTPSSGPLPVLPPGRADRRRLWISLAGVLIALLVVLSALWYTGVIPRASAPSSQYLTADTEGQAVAAAQPILKGIPGGPWNLSHAEGYAATNSSSFPFHPPTTCGASLNTTNATDGPYSGAYASGEAVLWLLMFASSNTPGSTVGIEVDQGVATDLGTDRAGCAWLSPVGVLGPVVDSSAAVEAVLATLNGTRFESMFTHADVRYILDYSASPQWDIVMNGCSGLFDSPGTLSATVWAGNGTIAGPVYGPSAC